MFFIRRKRAGARSRKAIAGGSTAAFAGLVAAIGVFDVAETVVAEEPTDSPESLAMANPSPTPTIIPVDDELAEPSATPTATPFIIQFDGLALPTPEATESATATPLPQSTPTPVPPPPQALMVMLVFQQAPPRATPEPEP